MRDFIDAIFLFIGSESLTDLEFSSISEDLAQEYTKDLYLALREVLSGRESVSSQLDKLKSYFVARGVDVSEETAVVPTSNIYIGGSLG